MRRGKPSAAARAGEQVLFLQGEPAAHPVHAFLAERLGAVVSTGAQQGSWVIARATRNAVRAARDDTWSTMLAETALHEGPLLRLVDRRHRRRVLLVANDWPRQIMSDQLGVLKSRILRWEFGCWDAYVVVSESLARDVCRIVGEGVAVYRWSGVVPRDFAAAGVGRATRSAAVAVMNGPDWTRAESKGLARVAALSRSLRRAGHHGVSVFGEWDVDVRERYADSLLFEGLGSTAAAVAQARCLVHLARWDAFAVVVVEAMMAGVPPIVSGSGAGWLVRAVEPRLVVGSLREAMAAYEWIDGLTAEAFDDLSDRLRSQAERFVSWSLTDEATLPVRDALAGREPWPADLPG